MQVPATEFLGRHNLAGGGFHQRRPTQEDGALVAHDHRFVTHRRNVGTAGGARPEHSGDLRDTGRAHRRLVEEDAAEVIAVGEHLVLSGQKRPAGVHQVETRQSVLRRDLLSAQMLFDRHRVVGAPFDGRVVGHDHAFPAGYPADAGDDSRPRAFIVVHAIGGQRCNFQQRTARVEQPVDPIPRQQLAAGDVPVPGALRAALRSDGQLVAELRDKLQVRLTVGGGRYHRRTHLWLMATN